MYIKEEIINITPFIKICYDTEPNLSYYHQYGNLGSEKAAEMETKSALSKNGYTYIIKENQEFIGYFIVEPLYQWNHITSFFIMPNYRQQNIAIFNDIKKFIDTKILITLKESNQRAIKFMKKINAKEYFKDPDNNIYFVLGDN